MMETKWNNSSVYSDRRWEHHDMYTYTLCIQDHFRYLQSGDFYEREVKLNVNFNKNEIIITIIGNNSKK